MGRVKHLLPPLWVAGPWWGVGGQALDLGREGWRGGVSESTDKPGAVWELRQAQAQRFRQHRRAGRDSAGAI